MTPAVVVVAVVGGLIWMVLTVVVLAKMIQVASPNEVLVVSGSRRGEGGQVLGYRTVRGGRVIPIPLLETLHRLDVTNLVVHERVALRSKGFIPLWIEVTANVRIAGEQPVLDKALLRIMGKSREEILRLASDAVLEATAGVVAKVTPEMLVKDRANAERAISEEVEHDLVRIGLQLDELRLRELTDDVGYLAAIAR
jgi:flotillin